MTSNVKVFSMEIATVVVNSRKKYYSRVNYILFFDSVSQCSYLSKILAVAVHVETIRTKYLAVETFGLSITECLARDVVSIIVTDGDDQERIQIEPFV